MSSQSEKATSAIGGKTARACDSCIRRRARWYCAADDAFLCQSCDASVHSANPLARRHDRVRLKTSSSKPPLTPPPAWHCNFTRKARTPRGHKPSLKSTPPLPLLVPDLENNEQEEEEQQLLYLVPEFVSHGNNEDVKPVATTVGEMFPTDAELAEFAADVECLLGFDNDAFCIEGLMEGTATTVDNEVKVEMEVGKFGGDGGFDHQMEVEFSRENSSLEINFDCEEEEEEEEMKAEEEEEDGGGNKIGLRLDYEAVITEWSSSCQGCSPWTDGERPQFNPDDCWPDFLGIWPGGCSDVQVGYGDHTYPSAQHTAVADGGREARVSRYREKRRTRLFSKKIRYEVRKLNAEKRPRMKGRFVKRTSFPPPAAPAGYAYA